MASFDDDEELPWATSGWMDGDSLAPPCQAEDDVVEAIIDACKLAPGDVLYDLGCGDGRICLAAAAREPRIAAARGVEIERTLCDQFRAATAARREAHGTAPPVCECVEGDLLAPDIIAQWSAAATVLVLYLLPEAIEQFREQLLACLRRGTRVVCNTWGIAGLTPAARVDCGPWRNVTLLVYDRSALPASPPPDPAAPPAPTTAESALEAAPPH